MSASVVPLPAKGRSTPIQYPPPLILLLTWASEGTARPTYPVGSPTPPCTPASAPAAPPSARDTDAFPRPPRESSSARHHPLQSAPAATDRSIRRPVAPRKAPPSSPTSAGRTASSCTRD